MVFHVLNRGVGRRELFERDDDYAAFEAIVTETLQKCPMRICGYCLMPNHWQFVLWPEQDGGLRGLKRLTITHVTRWQKRRHVVGEGHLYQGRFKSFPIETDEYFYQVMRYAERNALRAKLCRRAEQRRWGSLWRHVHGSRTERSMLSVWPLPRPRRWVEQVNEPQTEVELAAIRRSVARGRPCGSPDWIEQTAAALGLGSTLRGRGRPRKGASTGGQREKIDAMGA
jgi:putative transposase